MSGYIHQPTPVISAYRNADRRRNRARRFANDNPEREQETFEKCVRRELAGGDFA